jgi:hypothetical protein
MRTYSQEDHPAAFHETENYSVPSIDMETPHLPTFRFQFFSVERRVKRVLAEEFLLFLSFLLNSGRKFLEASFELFGYEDFKHERSCA